jgi:KDO2-lipid IV(A) lauroyltransferase
MLFLLRLAARLPLPLLHALGIAAGWLTYFSSKRYRKYLTENLSRASLSDSPLRHRVIAETGKAILELPAVWLRPHHAVAGLVVDVTGWEHVESAQRDGKGLILLTPHLGSWEIAAQYFSRRMPVTVMYNPPKVRALEPLMLAGRARDSMTSVPADLRGVRALMKALRRGEAIGMLPDQVPGKGEGEWVEFFGRPAYTMTLVARLAEQTAAPVLIGYAERLPWGRGYRLFIERLLPARPPQSPVHAMNRALERTIRACPAQYLWGYNRYKVPAGAKPPQQAGGQDAAERPEDRGEGQTTQGQATQRQDETR